MNIRLNIIEFAKLQAILTTLLGIVAGLIYSLGGLVIDILVSLDWITSSETPGLSIGTMYAFGALLGMPVIFGFIGFVAGIVEVLLFNLINKVLEIKKFNIYK